jgi:hypothetical protein
MTPVLALPKTSALLPHDEALRGGSPAQNDFSSKLTAAVRFDQMVKSTSLPLERRA